MSITNICPFIQTTVTCPVFTDLTDTALSRRDTAQPLLLLGKMDNRKASNRLTKLLPGDDKGNQMKALWNGEQGSCVNV